MREIKFRACDTKNKHVWMISERLHLQLQGNSWKIVDIDFGSQRWSSWNDPHIILSQYTGLKDKNGKEIYEGDVLIDSQYKSSCKYVVKWDEDNCCYVGKSNQGDKYGAFTLKMSVDCGYDKKKFNSYIKIIGNMYENPEILDKDYAQKRD